MDVSYLLDSLNDKQREAVAASRTNMLVLAYRPLTDVAFMPHQTPWTLR